MGEEEYNTRHHELPVMRLGRYVAVFVPETSEWFRKSVQPHLRPNVPVRIDAAPGYAYAVHPREFVREPVLARRLVLRWSAGRLYLDSARGTDGRPVDLVALLSKPTAEEVAEAVLRRPTVDAALSKSGLNASTKSQLADTARQESTLRLTLLSQLLAEDVNAKALCIKLLGASFGGCDPHGDLYKQATDKLSTAQYAPHLRDLLTATINNPMPSGLRSAAIAFCQLLQAADIEPEWVSQLLSRA
jgi:hypothetical protein